MSDEVGGISLSTEDSKTPKDLESEIAATAAALGGKSKKEKSIESAQSADVSTAPDDTKPTVSPEITETTSEPTESKETATTVKVEVTNSTDEDSKESQSAENPDTTEDAAAEETIEAGEVDEKEEVEATSSETESADKKSSAAPTPQPIHEIKLSKVKASIDSPPKEEESASFNQSSNEKSDEELATTIHSAKTLQPLTKTEQEAGDETDDNQPAVEAADEEKGEAEETTQSKSDEDDGQVQKSEAAHKLDAISGELKAREAEKKAAEAKDQQVAKIYDTKKYHLPIKAGRHHRKSSIPLWLQIVILLIALAGAAYYAYVSGYIDFGGTSSFLNDSSQTTLSERPAVVANKTGTSVFSLLPNYTDIGSADVRASFYYSQSGKGETITQDYTLMQNQAGRFWLHIDSTTRQVYNDFLRDHNARESLLASPSQAVDLIDVYNLSYYIVDGGPGTLPDYLASLVGSAATDCQRDIDSAIVLMSSEDFNTSRLEKFNEQTVEKEINGSTVSFSMFSLRGDSLDNAETAVSSAIDGCITDAMKKTAAKATLWKAEDVVFYIASTDDAAYIQVVNTALNQTIIDLRISAINQATSSDTPEILMGYNSPLSRQLAVIQQCQNSLPLQISVSAESFSLLTSDDPAYQIVAPLDVGLVCSQWQNQFTDTSNSQNIVSLANDYMSLHSLIESMAHSKGSYPSADALSMAASEIDAQLPLVNQSQIFRYTPTPENCGGDVECTSYTLSVNR